MFTVFDCCVKCLCVDLFVCDLLRVCWFCCGAVYGLISCYFWLLFLVRVWVCGVVELCLYCLV